MPDAKRKPVDLIIGRGLLTAETIASELRTRLAVQLSRRAFTLSDTELLSLARHILRQFEPLLAENLLNSDLASWIEGVRQVHQKLPGYALEAMAADLGKGFFPPSPPRFFLPLVAGGDDEPTVRFPLIEKAAESLLERRIVTPEAFNTFTAAERARAFTVAGEQSDDAIATIRDVLAENVREGTSLEGFRQKLEERIGKSRIGAGHLETIYRTNVQTAFHDGHDTLAANPVVAEVFPYQEYLAIHDARARENHKALETLGLSGTGIYRKDDPFWDYFTPAWDYNCRCGINLLTISAAARKGVREAERWLATGEKPPLESRLPFIPFRPPAGFGSRRAVAA